ncbi:metal ABC transporter permease [candidate division KSB1 bacterium]|nr:metal ABC transporter permease [candidate division KSB1 bacterium]
MVELLTAPIVACLVIAMMHAYLGIHIIDRKVIFVDLALAQIAALGAAFGFLMGFEYGDTTSVILGLLFTFIGAAIFSLTRTRREKVPQEAIIGIVYAVSAAAFILVMDRSPEGSEKIKGMLVGSVLFVTWTEIIRVSIIYMIIGMFHYKFRKQFLAISRNPEKAFQQGIKVRLWDFLFYISFGIVVTQSVRISGVLLVFSFLVVPGIIAVLFSDRDSSRLAIGSAVGVIASLMGIIISVLLDIPTGASIVCTFGIILIFVGIFRAVMAKL